MKSFENIINGLRNSRDKISIERKVVNIITLTNFSQANYPKDEFVQKMFNSVNLIDAYKLPIRFIYVCDNFYQITTKADQLMLY